MGQRNILRHFKAALRKAGVPDIRFHDLRHTAATLMLDAGATLKDVSAALRHSSIAITADYYAHIRDERKATLTNKVSDALMQRLEQKREETK